MSRSILNYCLLILLLLSLTACVSSIFGGASAFYSRHEWQRKFDNFYLDSQVDQALAKDQQLHAECNISATVVDGIALLTGQAPTRHLRQHAEHVTRHMPGVNKVINRIDLNYPVSNWRKTQDGWITTKITSKIIADSRLNPSKIHVLTEDGVVYLLGEVSIEQADLVITLAKDTQGVRKIVKVLRYQVISEHDPRQKF